MSSSPDLELEVAQKDIKIAHLTDHAQYLETQLFAETKSFKTQLSQLTELLEQEAFNEYNLILSF